MKIVWNKPIPFASLQCSFFCWTCSIYTWFEKQTFQNHCDATAFGQMSELFWKPTTLSPSEETVENKGNELALFNLFSQCWFMFLIAALKTLITGHSTNRIPTTRRMALPKPQCCVQPAVQICLSESTARLDLVFVRILRSSYFGYYVIHCSWYAFFVHNSPLLYKPT